MPCFRRSARLLRRFITLALLLGLLAPALPAAAQAPGSPPASAAEAPTAPAADDTTAPVAAAPIDPAVTSAVPCGPAVTGPELVALRTRTSRTYQGPNGSYQTLACADSVNYQDGTGAWQPIDNTLVAATASGYAYQNAANAFAALFPATLNGAPVKVSKGAASVGFQLVGAQGVAAAASGSTATYPGALPGVTAAYTVLNDGVKESLTLANAAAPSSFTFSVTPSPGLTARQNVSGGVDFVDASGVVQLGFAPPWMADSSGTPAGTSSAVTLRLAQAGAALTVTVAADPSWLANPARVWPVVLDPTTSLAPSPNCYILNGSGASGNHCAVTSLYAGYDGTNVYRSLLQFDLSSVPANSVLFDAHLALYNDIQSGSGSVAIQAMQLTQTWTSGVTWNTRDGTNAWTTAGGTFNATPLSSNTLTVGSANAWYNWGVTSLAQGWVNGTTANDGLLLKSGSEATTARFGFDSASGGHPAYLSVNYEPWAGELPFWTFYSHGLTDRSYLRVNVANGNLVLHTRDLTIAGTGLPLSIERNYNLLSVRVDDVGRRWELSLGKGVKLDNDGADGLGLYGPGGYAQMFYNNGSGGFVTPPGLDADLVKNGDSSYTLTFHVTRTKLNFLAPAPGGTSFLGSVVDKNGNTIALAYNANHTVSSVTDTQGRALTYAYNANNMVTSITDPTGRKVQYGYDALGNNLLTTYTDANNQVTTYTYDADNNLTKIQDPLGNYTTFAHDTQKRATSITYVTDPVHMTGPTYSFTYNSGNTVITDPNNNATTYFYDVAGRVTKVTDNAGNNQQFSWTSDNHVLTHTDAYSQTTNYTYSADGNNNLTKIQLPGETVIANGTPTPVPGASVSWAYADTSHPFYPTKFTDPQGNATSYTYDTPGNLKTITDALASQNQEQLFYNANGTVDHLIDFNGNTTSFTYDAKGNLTKVTPPSTTMPPPGAPLGPTTITPDSLSRPHVVVDGASKQTTTTFDALDRATLVTYNDNSTITYNIDADGNLTSMLDNTGTTSYTYDALNRKTKKTLPGYSGTCPVSTVGVICYTYDGASNLLSLEDDGGTVSYAYNSLNLLATLTEPPINGSSPQTTFTYDNNQNRKTTTYPGSTVETVSYDNAQRVTGVVAANGATTLNSFTYSYQSGTTDTALVQSVVRSDSSNDNSTTTNSYDVLNRLTTWAVTVPAGSALQAHTYTYGYDGNSNRTSINADGTLSTLSYNAANEWSQTVSNGQTNTVYWDAAGNMLGNNGFGGPHPQTITYNAKNQLASITDTQQNVIPMTYTGPGQAQRVSAGWVASNPDTPWGSNTYAYGSGLLRQTNAAGVDQGTIHYTLDPYGAPIAQRVPGTTTDYYYLRDAQGSVERIVDNAGNPVGTYDYCPTGNPPGDITLSTIALNSPIRYLGMTYDTGSKMDVTPDGPYCDANSSNCTQGGSDATGQNCMLPVGLQVFCNVILPGLGGAAVAAPLKDLCPPFLSYCGPDEGSGGASASGSGTGGRVPPDFANITPKIANQMPTRGWTQQLIQEAFDSGEQVPAINKATGTPATRYISPTTGQSVVIDNATGQIIQVGGPGFLYGPGSGDVPTP